MREPRPRQRLPEGGLEIFEKQKAGLWKPGNELILAYPANWKDPTKKNPPPASAVISNGYSILYQPHFDPMLYFWPVEGFQIIFHVASLDGDHPTRLVRSALRDGADMAILYTRTALTSSSRFFTQKSGWKKPDCEHEYQVRRGERR